MNKGFTLIELLVVIVIVAILGAIALPSFLNQSNRAKAAEATSYLGSINRAQQAYRLEQGRFATTLAELQIGIPAETNNYNYSILTSDGVSNAIAAPKDSAVEGFLGIAYVNGTNSFAILCRGQAGSAPSPVGSPPATNQCPGGSTRL